MAVDDVLRLLEVNPVYRNRVVHIETTATVPPQYGMLTVPLPETLDA